MPLRIAIADDVLAEAERYTPEMRDLVERFKEKEGVDAVIDAAGDKVARQLGSGLAATAERAQAQKKMLYILQTLDLAIQVVALARTPEEVEHIKRIATLLGRHHRPPVKVDVPRLYPALRAAIQQIAEEAGVHEEVPRNRERALIRRKVRAIIKIINESLANLDTKWESA